MEIKDLEEIQKITSFTELQKKFENLIRDGKAEENKELFEIGYASLISYPAIVLTKDFTQEELYAAQQCHNLMMQYCQSSLQRMAKSDDEKSKLAAALYVIPPAKRLLAGCNRFYMLDYLIQAECSGKVLSDIEGNDYAKQWNFILSKGFQDESTELAINDDTNHRVMSMRAIRQMRLNDESKELLNDEHIKLKMESYFHKNGGGSGTGCMIILLITGALGLLVSCI